MAGVMNLVRMSASARTFCSCGEAGMSISAAMAGASDDEIDTFAGLRVVERDPVGEVDDHLETEVMPNG